MEAININNVKNMYTNPYSSFVIKLIFAIMTLAIGSVSLFYFINESNLDKDIDVYASFTTDVSPSGAGTISYVLMGDDYVFNASPASGYAFQDFYGQYTQGGI